MLILDRKIAKYLEDHSMELFKTAKTAMEKNLEMMLISSLNVFLKLIPFKLVVGLIDNY